MLFVHCYVWLTSKAKVMGFLPVHLNAGPDASPEWLQSRRTLAVTTV